MILKIWDYKILLSLCSAFLLMVGCAKHGPRAAHKPPEITWKQVTPERVVRISTAVPFPRGLHLVDGKLYVLARGKGREVGGADPKIDDRAGHIFIVDPAISDSPRTYTPSPEVARNGTIFAEPTSPPFRLFNRNVAAATDDMKTDRPYCTLRYDQSTKNFYICAYSGIDGQEGGKGPSFSKNVTDAVLRYDTRSNKWYEVERHKRDGGGNYPHQDPTAGKPPHGWLNGPDNCLVVKTWLYCVAKENNALVRYDLKHIEASADAGPPPSFYEFGKDIEVAGIGEREYFGHSALAADGKYLYIGYRTSSVILRVRIDELGIVIKPTVGELLAVFDPWDPATKKSANITDIGLGPDGDLYVLSAKPTKIYRFHPSPGFVFDGRTGASEPWADVAGLTGQKEMKSENILVTDLGAVYVASGNAYAYHGEGSGGVIYRVEP